ncbi:MAG: MerR family transcriptional regulator [Bacteroidetes bacterium]|nr:MerR family transcriptional regulator [Bacteroidota bacterium]MBX7045079.1 MerR family transcriptional regulator [Ignavibacteria bacterium]
MAVKKNFQMKKLYYSISEVSKITELEQYVLRYWETEFEQLKPAKNLSGNRIYTNKDIQLILKIKKLLRDEKYTVEGAKKMLKNLAADEAIENERQESSHLKSVKSPSQGELSLFDNTSSTEQHYESDEEKVQLKKDLKELKSFLNNLLDEI